MPIDGKASGGVGRGWAAARRARAAIPSLEGTRDLLSPGVAKRRVREEEVRASLEASRGAALKLKEVLGSGVEQWGSANPLIPERRQAVGNLLAAPASRFSCEALRAEASTLQADLEWLARAERTDYAVEAGKGQFTWSDYIGANTSPNVQSILERFLREGQVRAGRLADGTDDHLDVSDGNLAPIQLLSSPELRVRAMADALLQIRARTDTHGIESYTATNTQRNWAGRPPPAKGRAEEVGIAQSAVQRLWLAKAELRTDTPEALREYALLRELVAASSIGGNNIFEARNAVAGLFSGGGTVAWDSTRHLTAWAKYEVPPGAVDSPYEAIHHNFSRRTARDIAAFVEEWMLPGVGPKGDRGPLFVKLVRAMRLAREGSFADARRLLASAAGGSARAELQPLLRAVESAPDAEVEKALLDFLTLASAKPLGTRPDATLEYAARVYAAVCADQPTVASLEKKLFRAGPAYPDVAGVIALMKADEPLALLSELGKARLALRRAIVTAQHGYERQERIQLDADLNRLLCEELGAAVERVGDLGTDLQWSEALLAVQAGLRGVLASGLGAIRELDEPATSKGPRVEQVLARIDRAQRAGRIRDEDYRELMGEAHSLTARIAQDIRGFFEARAARVAQGGVELDPFFLDQFIKESPLHYVTALTEKGMRAGREEVVTPRFIANVAGMRVLNSIGPVVFPSVMTAEDGAELARLAPPKDALAVVHHMAEKKLVMAGGLIVDTEDAPGGNSHLNVYGMNNGIPVIALPQLKSRYSGFFENAAREGGVYTDDHDGFRMMTVARARELGLVSDQTLASLRPGVNRVVRFLKPNAEETGFETLATHAVATAPTRPTREVELYAPVDAVRGLGQSSVTFAQLSGLGVFGRHLAGEKGEVLALLKADPRFASYVPDGSVVTTGRIHALLREAGLEEEWERPWAEDPKVPGGRVTDDNFTESAFYTDARYRASVRARLLEATEQKLKEHLIAAGPDGAEQLTPAGEALYQELMANPALVASDSWIARSSFTGEDRPGKSGAGQYESFPHLSTPVERVQGIIGVICSAWEAEPVENNVGEEINLQHIMPAVVVQQCLRPDVSGVVVSRDKESGARNRVTYQLVKGFGGGVEGGKAEEGVIARGQLIRGRTYPGEENGLVSSEALEELRTLTLGVERFFDEVMEPGKGHAIDMEVARQDGAWNVVQARVILPDGCPS